MLLLPLKGHHQEQPLPLLGPHQVTLEHSFCHCCTFVRFLGRVNLDLYWQELKMGLLDVLKLVLHILCCS